MEGIFLAKVQKERGGKTPTDVEAVLVAHYLRSDGSGGAGPLRYIDASRPELHKAFNTPEGVDPLRVLARACGSAYTVASVLANGWGEVKKDAASPGFFRFLVLTCAVVAAADEGHGSREFGSNLSAILGEAHAFAHRRALPGLWKQLHDWCRRKREAGLPIRQFILPRDVASTHYKYLQRTYAITFPTWRDLSHLRIVVDRHAEALANSGPAEAARRVCPLIRHDSAFSPAMKSASEEFHQLYEAQASLLRLHRFWTVLSRVLEARDAHDEVARRTPRVEIRCSFELEDAILQARVVITQGEDEVGSEGRVEGPADDVMQELSDWLKRHSVNKGPAAALLVSGAIPFLESGLGVWTASHLPADPPRRCLLLLSTARRDLTQLWNKKTAVGQKWYVVGPFASAEALALYEQLGFRSTSGVRLPSDPLQIVNGFRTGNGMLGRVALLPSVLASGDGNLSIYALDRDSPDASIAANPDTTGISRLQAATALDGLYTIRLEEEPVEGIDALAIERHLHFYRDAEEHVSVGTPAVNG